MVEKVKVSVKKELYDDDKPFFAQKRKMVGERMQAEECLELSVEKKTINFCITWLAIHKNAQSVLMTKQSALWLFENGKHERTHLNCLTLGKNFNKTHHLHKSNSNQNYSNLSPFPLTYNNLNTTKSMKVKHQTNFEFEPSKINKRRDEKWLVEELQEEEKKIFSKCSKIN